MFMCVLKTRIRMVIVQLTKRIRSSKELIHFTLLQTFKSSYKCLKNHKKCYKSHKIPLMWDSIEI